MRKRNNMVDLVNGFYQYGESRYAGDVQVYTDGSKNPVTNATGSAVLYYKGEIVKRTSDFLNVY